ncbi:aggregation factor core [Octadecabacter sp. CECT 8868]|uniref:aggregation factor core n=1 Tax=Octadecabacter algicola TaxID=2909342 RepID=UPI001F3A826B|nr:aggregation factor core [Octadecabacter algicola]MCF2904997.1 aggregation factor core [Octadecabacter algicola]
MSKLTLSLSVLSAVALSSAAAADLQVEFIEGAPKDRFVITNVGDCALGAGQFEIDFVNSSAGLIFDVSNEGAVVEVFQPSEITVGAEYLTSQPLITDGDQRAILDMSGIGVTETIAFTIDVDDTIGTRAITVADSEISGTTVSLRTDGSTYSAVMETKAQVQLTTPNCDA